MTTTFPASPYFDDYNEDKQFYRILFRPGRAVQARELTQLQTLAQAQIKRFGNHIFKNGSLVPGVEGGAPFAIDKKTEYVKINDLDSDSQDVVITEIEKGFTLTGVTSGVTGYVIAALDGVQTANDTKTIFLKYTSSSGANQTFVNGEQIQVRNSTGSLVLTVVALSSNSTGQGSAFSLGDGIVYVNGVFLKHLSQTIILERYSTTPSYKVGLTITESTVNSDTDESLLDPALNSSNYFATGADRYKITTTLVKKELDDDNTDNFFLLYEIEDGETKNIFEKAQYSVIQDELANRTYEESGDYVVKPFLVRVREHLKTESNGGRYLANTDPAFVGTISGNASLLIAGIEPGIGYVRGFRVSNFRTEPISIEKGIKFSSVEQQPISFGYGNYINVNELAGPWDLDNGVQISLRSSNAQAVTNETYGSTAAPGSEIGTARVKSVLYESGNIGLSDGQYRIYLYDVNLTANVPFANVRSVYFNAGSGSDSIGDLVLTSNSAVLEESNFNKGVFKFPQRAIRRLRATDGSIDNSFEFKKTFDVTIAVDGSVTVTSPVANEVFPFGSGLLNATQKRDNFVLVLNQGGTSTDLTGTIDLSTVSDTVTGNVTSAFTTQLKTGDRFITAGGNTYRVANITSATTLAIEGNALGNETNVTYQKVFAIGEYIDLAEAGSSGSTRSVDITSTTSAAIDIEETLSSTIDAKVLVNLQKTDGQEIQKTLRQDRYLKIDCSTAGTAGSYNLGFSDIFQIVAIYHGTDYSETNTNVTNEFNLDSGQRDSFYTHGTINRKESSTLTLSASSRLLVKLDYFFHDTSTGVGFFSVDSYPVDDTGTTFRTEDIPVFTSPQSGEKFDLRDCIDIRPRFTDTAADATSIAGATINPAAASTIFVPSGSLRVPAPNEEFNTDLEYYLSRKDVIYIDKSGRFGVETGLSEIYGGAPNGPADSMQIALISIPPYPSLSPELAKQTGRNDYAVTIKQFDKKRFTMSDIGVINQKVNRLEYYASLSFLEGDAKDKTITSDVTGLDRFKNGFLVDNFRGHSVGNPRDANYKISIDPVIGEMRPIFNIDNIDIDYNSTDSTNVYRAAKDAEITFVSPTGTFVAGQTITQGSITARIVHVVGTKLYVENISGGTFTAGLVTSPTASATITTVVVPSDGDLVTLPFTHSIFASNRFATKIRNCVGELLFFWVGEIELSPPADNWTDTRTRPDLVVNFDNNLDNWLALDNAWGTQWGDWNTNWSGTSTTRTLLAAADPVVTIDGSAETRARDDGTGGTGTLVGIGGRPLRTSTQTEFNSVSTTTTERQNRSGTNLQVIPETVNYDLGNRVVDLSIVPFIRSQIIIFSASRMKPGATVHAFFDDENVDQFVRPLGGNFGDPLVINSVGSLVGEFQIPNNDRLRFRVGQRLFKLTDDIEDRAGFTTTSASEFFNAFGIQTTQERTILSSRQARVGFTTESADRTVSTTSSFVERVDRVIESEFFDPIAQTFIVENTDGQGLFLTKLEVFFRTKSSTLPITLQVREVVNGFPGPRIIPFGSVTLFPDEINVSEDALSPTIFRFSSPVFLQDRTEYCFVLLPAGNNPDYNIWVSELGGNQLGTTNRVSEAPYLGVMFVSSNNKSWTPIQAEDIKFNLYRANFTTNSTGSVVLNNDGSDYLQITNLFGNLFRGGDTIRFANGTGVIEENDLIENVIEVLKDNSSARILPKLVATGNISANTSSNVVVGLGTLFNTQAYANSVIYSSNTDTRIGKIVSITDDLTVVIDSVSSSNITGNSFVLYDEIVNASNANIYATVETVNDKLVSLFKTNIALIDFVRTNTNSQYKIRDSSANTLSSYHDFKLNEDYLLESEGKIASNSTENLLFSNTKSFSVKVDISTSSEFVTPAIDLLKSSAIIVHNQINNDSTNETLNAGNALSRYISKRVTLDEGQDAEDLQVFVSAYKPPNTDIKVFARILNNEDSTSFSVAEYIELERVTSSILLSDAQRTNDYKEYEYKFPAANLTGLNGEVQYTRGGNTFTGYKHFAIKIVLLSTDTSQVPKVKNYRAIALQI